jgi:RnfABCDGE-type electron transport complex E subunit
MRRWVRMAEKKSLAKEFTKGLILENPVLRLVLGTCPTLAVSTSVESAIGMGLAATVVLVCSNIVISAMRKVIPSKVRIPAYVVIIAGFVSIVQMLVKAFLPQIDEMLGVYLPLIVVNCIILGRAEAFASKNTVLYSAIDGVGMGVGVGVGVALDTGVDSDTGVYAGSFVVTGCFEISNGPSFTAVPHPHNINITIRIDRIFFINNYSISHNSYYAINYYIFAVNASKNRILLRILPLQKSLTSV